LGYFFEFLKGGREVRKRRRREYRFLKESGLFGNRG
jgi:hypothetical protein